MVGLNFRHAAHHSFVGQTPHTNNMEPSVLVLAVGSKVYYHAFFEPR
jgi:hypothetical protein